MCKQQTSPYDVNGIVNGTTALNDQNEVEHDFFSHVILLILAL